ncbi:MAG: 50S ribosome-binding GTPase [Phycisphaerae bacterium]|nr:50S ribosome-binding GTPase [Phycisphaerae bacterium]
MASIAAVMTGPEAGAIATIELVGDSAEAVLRDIFHRSDGNRSKLAVGRVYLGEIVEEGQTIDHITVGCEGPDVFAIHCHGNPLIVDRIMGLLGRRGVHPVRPEQLIIQQTEDSIAAEAELALARVKTIEGANLVANQVKRGLTATIRRWRAGLDSISVEQIATEAKQILADSDKARLILSGCTVALVGPPNTGKSTLLNALAGREKAIVTDLRGTTRDWVTAEIRLPPLVVTLIDTAGLDPSLAASGDIDHAAQGKSVEAMNRADAVFLVLDAGESANQLPGVVVDSLMNRRVITVLNKADLPQRLDPASLPAFLQRAVRISAKEGTGIDDLIRAVHEVFGLTGFSLNTAVTFTDRQRTLIEQLRAARSRQEVWVSVGQLLRGSIR